MLIHHFLQLFLPKLVMPVPLPTQLSKTACLETRTFYYEYYVLVVDSRNISRTDFRLPFYRDFPHMKMKVLASMGERSICPDSLGEKLVGTPDGVGAYLLDDDTVRIVFQSESYGPLRYESYGTKVNDDSAVIGGSHVQYIDYDRTMLSEFMDNDDAASTMVVGMGQMFSTMYNLKGELVGPRSSDGPTTKGAHFSNTDAEGNYVVSEVPAETDWFLQSRCSAHLEEKHQWGENIGVEGMHDTSFQIVRLLIHIFSHPLLAPLSLDDMFLTNEEWIIYAPGSDFVGLSVRWQQSSTSAYCFCVELVLVTASNNAILT